MAPAVFNNTPFAQACLLMMDRQGQLCLCIMVSATYHFDAHGEPFVAPTQQPVPLADEPWGDPAHSSLRRASLASGFDKPGVDLVLRGCAHAPGGHPVTDTAVGVRIGPWTKVLTVLGDRQWLGFGGTGPSAPAPFTALPLCYERAFGGALRDAGGAVTAWHAANPVGVGWQGARSADGAVGSALPNFLCPGESLDSSAGSVSVAGFGPVARHWSPRVGYVGSYGAAWMASRSPLPPDDLDARFAQVAPADQWWPQGLPGEHADLANLTPEGRWRIRLPTPSISATVLSSAGHATFGLRLDTVEIDTEARCVTVSCVHRLGGLRRMGLVREVVIGEVSPAWLRARRGAKRYIGRTQPALAA